jgi:hypothetical protein
MKVVLNWIIIFYPLAGDSWKPVENSFSNFRSPTNKGQTVLGLKILCLFIPWVHIQYRDNAAFDLSCQKPRFASWRNSIVVLAPALGRVCQTLGEISFIKGTNAHTYI